MNKNSRYDIIIAGAGCAGLSLLVHLVKSGSFKESRILVVDRAEKKSNDRTWCFWEKGTGVFEQVVSASWKQLYFRSFTLSRLFGLDPYSYKLIRSADFYGYCLDLLHQAPHAELINGEITQVGEDGEGAFIKVNGEKIYGGYVFNSLLDGKPVLAKDEYYLLQHFKGWFIETPTDTFDPAQATMMDFRTSQQSGACFVYVMPFSPTRALVEYTLFSGEVLKDEEYEEGLKEYIGNKLNIPVYKILEEEMGVIPMTNHRFSKGKGKIIHIGTAGGQTRASTGYTFQFIQKHSAQIVKALQAGRNPLIPSSAREKRAAFYDSVLLNILHHETIPAHEIFTRLFARNDPRNVLRFLDKENNLAEDFKLVSTLPTLPFLKAALNQL
ncbi:MAG: lycopene cyclase family protein [Chitinophagaceae bacterium]